MSDGVTISASPRVMELERRLQELKKEMNQIESELSEIYYPTGKGIPIEALDVNTRIYRRLKSHGIYTISDLLNIMNEFPFHAYFRGIGKIGQQEIVTKLLQKGYLPTDAIP